MSELIYANRQHVLYKASDFTEKEIDRRNTLAIMVVEGGLDVCKLCGRAEIELQEPCAKLPKWR